MPLASLTRYVLSTMYESPVKNLPTSNHRLMPKSGVSDAVRRFSTRHTSSPGLVPAPRIAASVSAAVFIAEWWSLPP